MKTHLITATDVESIMEAIGVDTIMDDLIEALEASVQAYREEAYEVPARSGFNYTDPTIGLIEWMPLLERGRTATVKTVGYHPDNPARSSLPTIVATVSVYDTETGHLLALADATFLTALRTGAMSALASKLMARPDSAVIGLIGCGAQAVTQLHALTRCFPVTTVLMSDRNRSLTTSFRQRASAFVNSSIEFETVGVADVVGSSDILCTSTSIDVGQGPLFVDQETKPWLHINAIGSDFPGKYEIPVEFLRRSLVSPDFLMQALYEGECQQLTTDEIGPSLVDLAQEPALAESARITTSVFDSTGWSLSDHVATQLLRRYATGLDLGSQILLERTDGDVYNPYGRVTTGPRLSSVPTRAIIDGLG